LAAVQSGGTMSSTSRSVAGAVVRHGSDGMT
jgi:hypothetical protein